MTHPLNSAVIDACKAVYDPEIPVNIYDLGLIYSIELEDTIARINMTLTSPACPVAGEMPEWVKQSVEKIDGISAAEITLVWEPQWGLDKMTEEAQLELGLI